MKPAEIVALARSLAESAHPDRGSYSTLSAGRAVGATIGALAAAAIVAWAAPPTLAAAFLLATLSLTGRTLGGWITARGLRNVARPSWDQVELLSRTLGELGVRKDLIGPTLKALVLASRDGAALNDPVHILRLLPEEVFEVAASDPKRSITAGASQTSGDSAPQIEAAPRENAERPVSNPALNLTGLRPAG